MSADRGLRLLLVVTISLAAGVGTTLAVLHQRRAPAPTTSAPTIRPAERLPNLPGEKLLDAVPEADGAPFGLNYGNSRYLGEYPVRTFGIESRGYDLQGGDGEPADVGVPAINLPARSCTGLSWKKDWFPALTTFGSYSLKVSADRDLAAEYNLYQMSVPDAHRMIEVLRSAKADCGPAQDGRCTEKAGDLRRQPSPALGDATVIYADSTSRSCRHVEAYTLSSPFLITIDVYPDDPAYADPDRLPDVLSATDKALKAAAGRADATFGTTFIHP